MLPSQPPRGEETLSFGLRPGVSFCEISGVTVFLDSRTDRYTMLGSRQSASFSEICRFPAGTGASEKALRLANRLVSEGILTSSAVRSATIEPCRRNPPFQSLENKLFDEPGAKVQLPSPFHMARSFAACAPFKSSPNIASMLASVRRWKASTSGQHEVTPDRAISMAIRLHSLTPFLLSAHDACLFQSIFLMKYLTLQGANADLVFGVRLSPFIAHCWVEYKRTVLNDDIENVVSFTPILAV